MLRATHYWSVKKVQATSAIFDNQGAPFHVCWDSRFDKMLCDLRKAGGNAKLAARNADVIIQRFGKIGWTEAKAVGKQTKHGEARIKGCMKFNLGNGYRLISLRQDTRLVLLYIGTHDECDLWLEKNRGFERVYKENARHPVNMSILTEAADPQISEDPISGHGDEYEEALFRNIDDSLLRRIFSGLCVGW
ncbi:MAG: hypothetical protein A2521_12215 [Deltaproteobacteria bacterium RIFOXYD12_FULL_57_12]|nr:MAG: hypothetical protein A2521_12215 [Deltaproteobacteria bacterium RIFOXYD12_FULL_57_12]